MLYARIAGVAGVRLQIISRALALQVLLIVAVVPAAEATVIHLTTGGPIHAGDSASFSTTVTPNLPGDTLSYTWNINNQGNLGGAISGANPTVTWAQLNALGVTGNGSVPVSVQVADLDPNFYAPSGVQTNVPVSSLEGWTLAYVDTYNTIMSTDTVMEPSTKPYIKLGAGAT